MTGMEGDYATEEPGAFDYSSIESLLESISGMFGGNNFKDSRYAGIGGAAGFGGGYPSWGGGRPASPWGGGSPYGAPQWSNPFPSMGGGAYNQPQENTGGGAYTQPQENAGGGFQTSRYGMPGLDPSKYYGGQSNYYFGGQRSPYASFGSQYGGGYGGGQNFYGGYQPFRFASNTGGFGMQQKPSDAADQNQLSTL